MTLIQTLTLNLTLILRLTLTVTLILPLDHALPTHEVQNKPRDSVSCDVLIWGTTEEVSEPGRKLCMKTKMRQAGGRGPGTGHPSGSVLALAQCLCVSTAGLAAGIFGAGKVFFSHKKEPSSPLGCVLKRGLRNNED